MKRNPDGTVTMAREDIAALVKALKWFEKWPAYVPHARAIANCQHDIEKALELLRRAGGAA